jgi:hypothetical protein
VSDNPGCRGAAARLPKNSGRDTMNELKIGQYVYYVPRRAEGRYVVMRLLPQPKGKLMASSSYSAAHWSTAVVLTRPV